MVRRQLAARGIRDARVLATMARVPREWFLADGLDAQAYRDGPLPIGNGQAISQPYIVALMTAALGAHRMHRVLEIGTGSGYQTAVLARLVRHVFTVERLPDLLVEAEERLRRLKLANITTRLGDGATGWPEAAPFDGIVVTAAPERIPQPLLDQLKVGHRMVIPVGSFFQNLLVITKTADGVEKRSVIPVRFVPMTGAAQDDKQ